jgi:hypothetical protein
MAHPPLVRVQSPILKTASRRLLNRRFERQSRVAEIALLIFRIESAAREMMLDEIVQTCALQFADRSGTRKGSRPASGAPRGARRA